MRFFADVIAFSFVFLLGAVFGNCQGSMARAVDVQPSRVQQAFALDVARTAVNEASLGGARPADVDLVYEATRAHGATDHTRLSWLRRHSACANPAGDCNRDGSVNLLDDHAAERRPGNAGWTRRLRWSDARPAGYRGRWLPVRWRRVRARALRRVLDDRPTGVCGGARVVSWGRPSDFAPRPRLRPVDCGARNLGAEIAPGG